LKISKKLTWRNQLEVFEIDGPATSYEEVKKKASAWFKTTYEPWMIHIEKYQKTLKKNRYMLRTNEREEKQVHQRYNGLFSFAWVIYPVLLRIFQEKEDDSKNNTQSKKNKRKRDPSVLPSKKNLKK
jgi:hypothetical protein